MSGETHASHPVPTPRYRDTIASATQIALQMGNSHVGVEHLFIAIIRDPDSIPTSQLAKFVSVSDVESRIFSILNSAEYHSTAPDPPEA
jgi:hypothetical protein